VTEARFALLVSFAAFAVSFLAFYYQYLRTYHHLSAAILKWNYSESTLSVSVAFVNYGNKDEIVLDSRPIVAADKNKPEWQTKSTDASADWLVGVGKDSFVIPAGAVIVKRVEIDIADKDLPFVEINEPQKAKKTDVGVRFLYLGRNAEVMEKVAFFASIKAAPLPNGLASGGDATGYVHSRTNPLSFELLKYSDWPGRPW
jgi:hypothetical protein